MTDGTLHSWEGWAGAVIAALLGALIGSCVPLLWALCMRRRERRGELMAMQVEMYHARRAMTMLQNDGVLAPLYHLPLGAFNRALPKLIGEGVLSPNEVAALVEYAMRAEELNRGLERAREAASRAGDTVPLALQREYDRNVLKVEHILNEEQKRLDDMTLFAAAESALYRVNRSIPPEPSRD